MSESTANDEKKRPGPGGSGKPGTGPEILEADEKKIATRKKSTTHLTERVTSLKGQSIAGRPSQPKSVRRRLSMSDISSKDPEIPYVKFEAAAKDLICSLMERQDRMNEEIFLKLNDIAYRVEDLEQDLAGDGGGQ